MSACAHTSTTADRRQIQREISVPDFCWPVKFQCVRRALLACGVRATLARSEDALSTALVQRAALHFLVRGALSVWRPRIASEAACNADIMRCSPLAVAPPPPLLLPPVACGAMDMRQMAYTRGAVVVVQKQQRWKVPTVGKVRRAQHKRVSEQCCSSGTTRSSRLTCCDPLCVSRFMPC